MTSRPRVSKRQMAAALAGAVCLLLSAHSTESAEVPADLDAYCETVYGPGTEGGIDRRDNNPLCTEHTNGGLGLLHHRVDPADVCSTQHHTSRFRREGGQLVCLADSGGDAAGGSDKIDLTEYCQRNDGPSAFVSRRLTDDHALCTVKGDGGLSQVHHEIDIGELCGNGGGKVSPDDTLDCGGEDGAAGGNGGGDAGGGGTGNATGGGSTADIPILTKADLAELDLSDCGYPRGDEASMRIAFRNPEGKGGWGWRFGGVDTACKALGQGVSVDLGEFCRRTQNSYYGDMTVRFTDSGRPLCVDPTTELPPYKEADFSGTGLQLIWACSDAYPGGMEPFQTGELGTIVKYVEGHLECFYFSLKADTYEIVFVESEPPYNRVEDLVIGRAFRIRLTFAEPPERDSEPVTVENKRTNQTIELVAEKTDDDPRIFLTAPVDMAGEVSP